MNTWVTLPYLGQVNIWNWRIVLIVVLLGSNSGIISSDIQIHQ